jgi:hypothetical protein
MKEMEGAYGIHWTRKKCIQSSGRETRRREIWAYMDE